MTQEQLEALPIGELSTPDSVLIMWVVNPQIPEAIRLGEAWGFTFKTVLFTWIKANKSGIGHFFGMGYYTRANMEQAFLFTRGKGLPVLDRGVFSLIYAPLRQHSRKPDEIVIPRIDRLFGNVPRVELFARYEKEGWDQWGNTLENDIELEIV